jgi:ADP-heptose:LPS heptosyltransferase
MHNNSSVRKVLIYRTGSLGDTVVALPCFHLIARTFPQAERVLLTDIHAYANGTAAMAVLGESGLVHRDMRYPGSTRKIGDMLRLAWNIWRFRPDVLVYLLEVRSLKRVRRDKAFFRLAGVRRIVGLPGKEELMHRFDPVSKLYESEASRLARSIAVLGDAHPEDITQWDLLLTSREKEMAVSVLPEVAGRKLIAWGPGSKMQAKDWGQDNWRLLLGRLYTKYPSYVLVMTGAMQEKDMCEYAASEWAGTKVNLAGRLSPRETAAVLSHATVFIGPDSGPKHLAASVGVPCVCVFSARDEPGIWFPPGERNVIIYHQTECHGCRLETCILMGKKCILSVTVDEMEDAVNHILTLPSECVSHNQPV